MRWSASTGVLRTADLSVERLPTYTVGELNAAVGSLLERGFAPRFLLDACVSRPQLKKGHLWLTLTDGKASISGVVWASKLAQLSYRPVDGDGVTVVGKLNFWAARASLTVQALDIRPSLTTVLRQFEEVRRKLEEQGVIDSLKQRMLPAQPSTLAILTSVPSSALADMLRTARERWPMTTLLIIPIPVQGDVAERIVTVVERLATAADALGLDAVVLARGGGSREDLAVFDNEQLCRSLANFPVPVVTGLGHEDDLTVVDLVADHRAATPTAAIVALLPSQITARRELEHQRRRMQDHARARVARASQQLAERKRQLMLYNPLRRIEQERRQLDQKRALLQAMSPSRWLKRGLALVQDSSGAVVTSIAARQAGDKLSIQFHDGQLDARVEQVQPAAPETKPRQRPQP